MIIRTLQGTALSAPMAGVVLLQQELRKMAQSYGDGKLDPGRYDGTMDLGTLAALARSAAYVDIGKIPHLNDVLSVFKKLEDLISKIPYAGQVLNLILSPWVIDEAFDAVLGVINLFPGTGSAVSAVKAAMKTAQNTVASAALPISQALSSAPKKKAPAAPPTGPAPSLGLGAVAPAHVAPAHVPCPTGLYFSRKSQQCAPLPTCAPGQYFSIAVENCKPIPTCKKGTVFVPRHDRCAEVREHRRWPKNEMINPNKWGGARQFQGHAELTDLHPSDQKTYALERTKHTGDMRGLFNAGAIAFLKFTGFDGRRMGAWWNAYTKTLKIAPLPRKKKKTTKYPWDYASDALDYTSDAVKNLGEKVADVPSDVYDFAKDNVDDVYRAVKKYGCTIVSNDIIVTIAAGGTAIIATPAASATLVAGSAAARGACAVLDVGEAVLAIYKLLAHDWPAPPAPGGPAPAPGLAPGALRVVPSRIRLLVQPPEVRPLPPLTENLIPGTIQAYDSKSNMWVVLRPQI
jgi:hypothetical protein